MAFLRSLAVLMSLIALAYLEFEFYPGHTFLQGSSQLFVPMLERLHAPGLLSRDLLATHPLLNYTTYDEWTLFLQSAAHFSFARALAAQQFSARVAALVGIYLLVRSTGVSRALACLVAAVAGLGVFLPGVLVSTAEREPVPYTMAFGFVLLALGLLVDGKVLLCSLAAGLSLLYSPGMAAPLWIFLIGSAIIDRALRPMLRPFLTALLVFTLLLANLAQLQPSAAGTWNWFGTVSDEWLHLIRSRTPDTLVATWAPHEFWLYLAVYAAGLWAFTRIWSGIGKAARWVFAALPLIGLLSVPLTAGAQWMTRSVLFTQTAPARALMLTVGLTLVLCASAALISIRDKRWREAIAWSSCLAGIMLAGGLWPHTNRDGAETQVRVGQMAEWAERNTWGGSMFLFADAGRSLNPGIFRAMSLRPVFVDWQSGEMTRYYEDFGEEWRTRWKQVHGSECRTENLAKLLQLPIDYYVLQHRLPAANVMPVFTNADFAVYDARDLRVALRRTD